MPVIRRVFDVGVERHRLRTVCPPGRSTPNRGRMGNHLDVDADHDNVRTH